MGIGVGARSALGARAQNLASCPQDRESTMAFFLPGMCFAWHTMLLCKQAKTRILMRYIEGGDLKDWLFMISTTALLS